MKNNNKRKFTIQLENCGSFHICTIGEVPVIGRGSSPVEAIVSACHGIQECLYEWDQHLTIEHAEDFGSLKTYGDLKYFLSNFCGDLWKPIIVAPRGGTDE